MRHEVHFLAKYAAHVRGETLPSDAVAETYFPFISSRRFTLVEFVRELKEGILQLEFAAAAPQDVVIAPEVGACVFMCMHVCMHVLL